MISLTLRDPQGAERTLPINPGLHSAGGGPDDDLPLEGAPPHLFDLEVSDRLAIVVAQEAGVRWTGPAGKSAKEGRVLPVSERWLLRAGDTLQAEGYTLCRAPDVPEPTTDGTAALARGLLGGAVAGTDASPLPALLWLNGRDCGKRVALLDEATFLGRGEGSGCRVRDALASRTHAKLLLKDGRALLSDLVSANGVFVDGERLDKERALQGGEVLRIGETELYFEAALPPPSPPPPPSAPEKREAPAEVRGPSRPSRFSPLELLVVGTATVMGAVATAAVWVLAR